VAPPCLQGGAVFIRSIRYTEGMIYFLHGTDTDKARAKGRELVASLQKKKPDAAFFTVNAEIWNASGTGFGGAVIDEYAGGQGLFENKFIVLVDRVGEEKDNREELAEKAALMAESDNIFIVVEGKLDKPTVTALTKVAAKTQEFEVSVGGAASGGGKKSDGVSIFAIGDAFGRRDKKELWTLYRQFIDMGMAPEEIHGTLFWQAKSIAIAARASGAGDSGLSPFVYQKAKAYADNFKPEELRKLLDDLIAVSHDSRRGKHELETALEMLLLKI
jgi:DNA polymerase III delta subunit